MRPSVAGFITSCMDEVFFCGVVGSRRIEVLVRDWSLITGRGALQNEKFYHYEKGGGQKKF